MCPSAPWLTPLGVLFGWELCIWTTMDTTVRTGWGCPGNTWDKDWKRIKGKPLWFGIPQHLWLRSADWSKGNLPSSNTENPRRIMSKIWATAFRKFVFCKCFSLVLKLQTALKACIPYFYLLSYTDFVLSRLILPGNFFFFLMVEAQ